MGNRGGFPSAALSGGGDGFATGTHGVSIVALVGFFSGTNALNHFLLSLGSTTHNGVFFLLVVDKMEGAGSDSLVALSTKPTFLKHMFSLAGFYLYTKSAVSEIEFSKDFTYVTVQVIYAFYYTLTSIIVVFP